MLQTFWWNFKSVLIILSSVYHTFLTCEILKYRFQSVPICLHYSKFLCVSIKSRNNVTDLKWFSRFKCSACFKKRVQLNLNWIVFYCLAHSHSSTGIKRNIIAFNWRSWIPQNAHFHRITVESPPVRSKWITLWFAYAI